MELDISVLNSIDVYGMTDYASSLPPHEEAYAFSLMEMVLRGETTLPPIPDGMGDKRAKAIITKIYSFAPTAPRSSSTPSSVTEAVEETSVPTQSRGGSRKKELREVGRVIRSEDWVRIIRQDKEKHDGPRRWIWGPVEVEVGPDRIMVRYSERTIIKLWI